MIRRAGRCRIPRRVVHAGVALLLVLATAISPLRWLVICGLMLLAGLMSLEALRNLRCPECLERSLERADRRRFGRPVVRCRGCGRCWSRDWIGPWEPLAADWPGRSPRNTDPWRGGPVIDGSTPTDNTHGRLLQAKQAAQARRPGSRRDDAPPVPDAE